MDLDFRNAYIRCRPGSKKPIDSGWGIGEPWTRPDADVIRQHLADGGNVAILTGSKSGHFTVDFDPEHEGYAETIARLKAEGKTFPRTNRVNSPSGGFHLNYRIPEGIEVRNDQQGKVIGPGVDLRGEGGFRVAPGSQTPKGVYTLAEGYPIEYLDAPEWLVKALAEKMGRREARKAAVASMTEVEKTPGPDCCRKLAHDAVASIEGTMKRLAGLPEGQRIRITGEDRGWDTGFWILAVRLVEIARWPYTRFSLEAAQKRFLALCPDDGIDPAHIWERALETAEGWRKGEEHRLIEHVGLLPKGEVLGSLLGEPGDENDSQSESAPYSTSVAQESYLFTAEFIDRHFRTRGPEGESGILRLRFHHDDRSFWLWRGSRYIHQTEDQVKSLVAVLLVGATEIFMSQEGPEERAIKVKPRIVGEIVECLRMLTLTAEEGPARLLPATGGVPFRNGWLDAKTGVLEPLGPARDVRWNVQADYDPDATCMEWNRFLDSIGFTEGSGQRRLLRQWMGYLLSGENSRQRGMLLLGPKRAGKGTVRDVCHALLGDGATGFQLDSFASNFGMQSLIGKGLASIGDARFGLKTDKKVIERILSLTGNDPMNIDVKHKDPMNVRLGARLMLLSNEPPSFIEASDALSSRFLVLDFNESFFGREDFGLLDRLLAELPGIAHWALEGYRDLEATHRFAETEEGLAIQTQMTFDSAPVRGFVEEECEIGAEFQIESQRLFDEYLLWCEHNNVYKLSKPAFFRDLNVAYPGKIHDLRGRRNGKRVQAKTGIRLRSAVTNGEGQGGQGGGQGGEKRLHPV